MIDDESQLIIKVVWQLKLIDDKVLLMLLMLLMNKWTDEQRYL